MPVTPVSINFFAFSGLLLGMHHKTNPIIFYLDLDVAEGKSDGADNFINYLVETVEKTEPKTMYYKYWISEDKKSVSLMEVYHSNEDAIFHMNAFAEAPHRDKFLETFIEDISVNGVDMIEWNSDGQIVDFKVMIRPYQAVQKVQEKMIEALEGLN